MDTQPTSSETHEETEIEQSLGSERWQLLNQIEDLLELPMVILGFIWLVILVIELTAGSNPALDMISNIIWVIFIVDFLVKFFIAPKKKKFVVKNWLTILALALPALRILRAARALRVLRLARSARGLQLLRLVGSFNRGMRSLRRTMQKRNFGYVIALTIIVSVLGALGMHTFERGGPAAAGFSTYAESLWWTIMILMTLGSSSWPATPEGRILAVLLASYGLAMFGYVTAMLASFFVGRDEEEGDAASVVLILELKEEVRALRSELANRPERA